MARPLKSGLDYFPLDSNFFGDPKIEDLLYEHGPSGLAIFLAILCRIYREGYYLAATPEQITRMVIKDIGGQWIRKPSLVSDVIRSCAASGLFDPGLVAVDVFTSPAIQKRYAKATARNKGKMNKYCLIDVLEENGIDEALESAPEIEVSATETRVIVTETPISATETPTKKRKEKNNKKEIYKEKEPSEEEVLAYCRERGYAFGMTFYRHYAAQGWLLPSGLPLADWRGKADAWAANPRNKTLPQETSFDPDEAMAEALKRNSGLNN